MNTKHFLAITAGALLLAACGKQGGSTPQASGTASAASAQANAGGVEEEKVLNYTAMIFEQKDSDKRNQLLLL